MDLFDKAMEQFKSELVDELEQRLWARLENRIERSTQVMTIYEAADYLKTSDRTLRRMVHEQSIPTFRVRNRIFIRQTDLDYWIQKQLDKQGDTFDHDI